MGKSPKKSTKKRRSWFSRKKKRTKAKRKVPYETLIMMGSVPFTDGYGGAGISPIDAIMQGNAKEALNQLSHGFIGFDLNANKFDFTPLINPLDFSSGGYLKRILYGTGIGIVRRKLTAKYTDPLTKKIPFIGKWVG